MDKVYNTKEIEAIKYSCKLVRGLIYTASYYIDMFKVIPDEKDNIKISFRIRRYQRFERKIYTLYQTGHFYISPKGKLFYYNFMGNKKPFKHFGPIVSRFLETYEEE